MNVNEWPNPHSGEKQECPVCGAFKYPAIHSCPRIPRTEAAWERYAIRTNYTGWLQVFSDGPRYYKNGVCTTAKGPIEG